MFPRCVQDSGEDPRYNELLQHLSSSILFLNTFMPISRADAVPRRSSCVDPLLWLCSVKCHGSSLAGLGRCSLLPALLLFSVGLRKREGVFLEGKLRNQSRSMNATCKTSKVFAKVSLNKVSGLYSFQWQISVPFFSRNLSTVMEHYTRLQSAAA